MVSFKSYGNLTNRGRYICLVLYHKIMYISTSHLIKQSSTSALEILSLISLSEISVQETTKLTTTIIAGDETGVPKKMNE